MRVDDALAAGIVGTGSRGSCMRHNITKHKRQMNLSHLPPPRLTQQAQQAQANAKLVACDICGKEFSKKSGGLTRHWIACKKAKKREAEIALSRERRHIISQLQSSGKCPIT